MTDERKAHDRADRARPEEGRSRRLRARERGAFCRITDIVATGTTGGRVLEACPGLRVTRLKSGPLGGDQQIGALIATGEVDALIFFVDPLTPMPHDVDVKALMRLAIVYDIPHGAQPDDGRYPARDIAGASSEATARYGLMARPCETLSISMPFPDPDRRYRRHQCPFCHRRRFQRRAEALPHRQDGRFRDHR